MELQVEAVLFFSQQLLDYEACNSYTFSVEVANPIVDARYLKKGPFKDQATVRVMVLNADEPPQFSQARYHLDVSENCPPVCSVGRVYAVDPDTGQSTNIRWLLHHHSPISSVALSQRALFTVCPPYCGSYLFSCIPGTPSILSPTPRLCSASLLTQALSAQWWSWTVRRSSGIISQSSPHREVCQRLCPWAHWAANVAGSYFTNSIALVLEIQSGSDRNSAIISPLMVGSFSFQTILILCQGLWLP